jgi:cytosine/adenosine deaminase-related metal-dependent hydrolase
VHVSGAEIRRLAAAGAMVVHNPQSNMHNAVGVAPVPELLRAGVTVGLGTDGMTANMRDEVRVTALLHPHHLKDSTAFFAEACDLLLQNNARIASRLFGRPVGALEKGALGDVVILDYDPPTPLTGRTFAGHFLFGICSARVTTTIVGGNILMRDGELCGIDAERIAALARRQAQSFWRRF